MNAYRIFTIESGSVHQGALVEKLTLQGAQTVIPAILIGEEGRGRQRGVLPVTLTASQQAEWQEKGRVTILFAETGTSQSGKPKLIARESGSDEKIICVFRTKIGFRGGNSHTGDRKSSLWSLTYSGKDKAVSVIAGSGNPEEFAQALPEELRAVRLDTYGKHSQQVKRLMVEHYGLSDQDFEEYRQFDPFPGETLISGTIAQGTAGNMGSGSQLVAILPKDVWFRTSYSGRLYGAQGSHYYRWDGENLSTMTWDERQTLEALVEDGALPTVAVPAPVVETSQKLLGQSANVETASTVVIPVGLLNRLMAGNTDMDAVLEAAALLPKS